MKALHILAAASLFAVAALGVSSGKAAAYGAADQPLAQIEFSANCNNPDYFLCAPPPAGIGLGGGWVWIEIDSGGTGDAAGAGCAHVPGLGGGAGSILGEVQWWPVTASLAELQSAGIFAFSTDPSDSYYVVVLPDPMAPPFAFPRTVGHYSFHPAPGVAVETQIAP